MGATRPFLHVENATGRTLTFRALARLKGGKGFVEVTEGLVPIADGEAADRCWGFDEQVEEVVLFDFRLSGGPGE